MVSTGWIIAGSILVFILILLLLPIVVWFDYGKAMQFRVRYLFFTIYRYPAGPKKRRKKKNNNKTKTKSVDSDGGLNSNYASQSVHDDGTCVDARNADKEKRKKAETGTKMSLSEMFELLKVAVDSLARPLKKLCKRIKIIKLRLDIVCGGDDAAKAALNYGRTNLIVSNAFGWLGSIFTLKKPQINIKVDFQSEETVTECSCKIRLSVLAALIFLIGAVVRFLNRAGSNEKVSGYFARRKENHKDVKNKNVNDRSADLSAETDMSEDHSIQR